MHSLALKIRRKRAFAIGTIQESLVAIRAERSGQNADITKDTLEIPGDMINTDRIKIDRTCNKPQGACPRCSTFCTAEIMRAHVKIWSGTNQLVRTSKFCEATSGDARTREQPRPESTQILTSYMRRNLQPQGKYTHSPQAPPTFLCLSKPRKHCG